MLVKKQKKVAKPKETSRVLKKHLKEIGIVIPSNIDVISISYEYKKKK